MNVSHQNNVSRHQNERFTAQFHHSRGIVIVHIREEYRTTTLFWLSFRRWGDLHAVEDLELLPFPEAEVILRAGLIVVQSHEQSHS